MYLMFRKTDNLLSGKSDRRRSPQEHLPPSVASAECDMSDNRVDFQRSTTQRIILYVEFAGSSSLPPPCWLNQFTKVNILAFGVLVKSV